MTDQPSSDGSGCDPILEAVRQPVQDACLTLGQRGRVPRSEEAGEETGSGETEQSAGVESEQCNL